MLAAEGSSSSQTPPTPPPPPPSPPMTRKSVILPNLKQLSAGVNNFRDSYLHPSYNDVLLIWKCLTMVKSRGSHLVVVIDKKKAVPESHPPPMLLPLIEGEEDKHKEHLWRVEVATRVGPIQLDTTSTQR